jgi:hypothetical protein
MLKIMHRPGSAVFDDLLPSAREQLPQVPTHGGVTHGVFYGAAFGRHPSLGDRARGIHVSVQVEWHCHPCLQEFTSLLVKCLCFSEASNASAQARLEAGARQLGKDKVQCLTACFLILPVENRPCHFDGIRLSTCDHAPGGHHEASVPISPVPQVSTHVQLARSLGTFGSLFSQARGLRHPSSSWCPQLSWVQTPMPHPTLREGVGVSLGSPFPTYPLALPSLTKPPVFDLEDSHRTRQVACFSPCPFRSLRLPSLWIEGRTG